MFCEFDHKPFWAAVAEAKTVFLTAHVGPDGDTLGSMLALKHVFKSYFPHITHADCVISGKMPDLYRFLPGIHDVHNVETSETLLAQYDLAISVDCGSLERLGPASSFFSQAKQSVNIDHHISNQCFGQLNVVVPSASASGEVIADLMAAQGLALTKESATCIYAAILTDSGGFKYSNTTAKLLRLASELVAAGANPELIYKNIYEEQPRGQLELLSDAVLRAQYNKEETLGWTVIHRSDLERFGCLDEHLEGVVEAIRSIDTILVSAIFKETLQGFTKVSLRSDRHDINVADIMALFGGGGHKMAAGCTIQTPPKEAMEKVLPLLEEALRHALGSLA